MGFNFNSRGQVAKLTYVLALAVAVLIAIGCKYWFPASFDSLNSFTDCNNQKCLGNNAVYRFSFAVVVWFLGLAFSVFVNPFVHYDWWSVKFIFYCALIIISFFIPNDFFTVWAEIARIVSFLFLLMQIFILITTAYDLHDWLLNSKISNEEQQEDCTWKAIYLGLCLGLIGACLTGIALLFKYYGGSDCQLHTFFIILSLVLGVVGIILSIIKVIDKGLLVPCLVWSYAVYLCWQAVYSSPNLSCNPNALNSDNIGMLILGLIIAGASLTYTVWSTSTGAVDLFRRADGDNEDEPAPAAKSEIELTDGKKGDATAGSATTDGLSDAQVRIHVQRATSLPPARKTKHRNPDHIYPEDFETDNYMDARARRKKHYVFHLIMAMGGFYMSMLLTNWGSTSGNPQESVGKQSMWIKIVSQWATYLVYVWTLVGPLLFPDRDFRSQD